MAFQKRIQVAGGPRKPRPALATNATGVTRATVRPAVTKNVLAPLRLSRHPVAVAPTTEGRMTDLPSDI